MHKIWAKVIIDHKVKRSIVHDCGERLDEYNFFENLKSTCEALKIPTPVIINTHIRNFLEFNILKLRARDFLEEIPFDFLLLESGDT